MKSYRRRKWYPVDYDTTVNVYDPVGDNEA